MTCISTRPLTMCKHIYIVVESSVLREKGSTQYIAIGICCLPSIDRQEQNQLGPVSVYCEV